MNKNFNYPINLKKAKEGGYVVTFPDFPEAITQGDSLEEAISEAGDCLEEAISNRMMMKLDIPEPSEIKKQSVSLHITLAAKAALYMSMRAAKLSNVAIAEQLHCDEKEIRRLLDPHHSSKLPRLEHVLEKLGLRLSLQVTYNV